MPSKISYNIHAQGLANQNKLLAHLNKIQPKAVLVMDGFGLCRIIKSQNPNTIVIHREWPDDDIYARVSPAQWLAQKRTVIGNDDIWAYTTNEPGFDQRIISWHEELIKLNMASPNPLKIVIMNISAGVPKPDEWKAADNLLRLAAKYKSHVIFGLHEYFGGVATSGFIGSSPEDIRYHPNYIVRSNWPLGAAAKSLTKWHCGRYKFMSDYCTSNGIDLPRIILTEHGADAMGDVDSWLKSLKMTSPYNTIRGYKTLENQWKIWYPEWSSNQAYFEQLKYLDQNVYKDSNVEAQLIFCYGQTAGAQWGQFNVEGADEFIGLMEQYANTASVPTPPVVLPTPPPPPPVVPPVIVPPGVIVLPEIPADFISRSIKVLLTSTSGGKLNVRAKPTTSSEVVASITSPVDALAITSDALKPTEKVTETISGLLGTWIPVNVNNVYGWIFDAFLTVTVKKSNVDDLLKSLEITLVEAQTRLNSISDTIKKIRDNLS